MTEPKANEIRVILIGAGQIGSRHLQALAKSRIPLRITAIDSNLQSLAVAQERYEAVKKEGFTQTSARFLTSMALVDAEERESDFLILSTSAEGRLSLLREAVREFSPRFCLLEKVVFQDSADFFEANTLLQGARCEAWVNCSRRMWPLYQEVRKGISQKDAPNALWTFRFSAANWGLASNSVHFLDLCVFLFGTAIPGLKLESDEIKIVPSKRAGCFEILGVLKGESPRLKVELLCVEAVGARPPGIQIIGPGVEWFIDESKGKIEGWQGSPYEFSNPFQSDLTQRFIQEVLDTGKSQLPTLQEVEAPHQRLFEALLPAFRVHLNNPKLTQCPIS